ncbi:MAG TPA: hypothetical protein VFP55_07005 [Solirubrobacteraceae bacterium]|nr:hypothetical protein [Solirubrobacteraceae bacterium]
MTEAPLRLVRALERDYHDAYLLLSGVIDEIDAEFQRAEHAVKIRATDAAAQPMAGGNATVAAGRQMGRLGDAGSQRAAEATVRRSARRPHALLIDKT